MSDEPQMVETKSMTPVTRRRIVFVLGVVALAAIGAHVVLAGLGMEPSESLANIALTAVGAIAGMAMPQGD